MSLITTANTFLAKKLTMIMATMWTVYAFFAVSLFPSLFPAYQNTILYISNCIQLIALPAIMVGSALLNANSEARAAADHAAVLEILNDVQTLVTDANSLLQESTDIAAVKTEIITVQMTLVNFQTALTQFQADLTSISENIGMMQQAILTGTVKPTDLANLATQLSTAETTITQNEQTLSVVSNQVNTLETGLATALGTPSSTT